MIGGACRARACDVGDVLRDMAEEFAPKTGLLRTDAGNVGLSAPQSK